MNIGDRYGDKQVQDDPGDAQVAGRNQQHQGHDGSPSQAGQILQTFPLFHGGRPFSLTVERMASRKGKKSDIPSALDRLGHLTLVLGTVARNPARDDLAAFGYEVTQAPDIFIINLGLVDTKTATLATGETATWLKRHIRNNFV